MLIFRRSEQKDAGFDIALERRRGELLTSSQLPGFSLALSGLFPEG